MSRLEYPFDYTYPPLVSKRAGAFMICPCPFSALSLPVHWESCPISIEQAENTCFFLLYSSCEQRIGTYCDLFFFYFLDVLLPYLCELHYIFIFLSLSKQFVNKLVLTKYFLTINTTDKRTFKKINLILGSRKIKRENILNLNLQYFFIIAITLFMSGKTKHLFLNVHRHLLYRVLYKRTNGSTPSASASRSDFSLYCISRETGHLLDFFPPDQRNIWSGARSRIRVCRSPKDNGGRWGPGSNRYLA
jgi:hypothetical protein